MRKPMWPRTAALLFCLLAACSGDSPVNGPAAGDFSADEMAAIAMETDGLVDGLIDEQDRDVSGQTDGTSAATSTTEVTVSRTRPCPVGGELVLEGRLRRVTDRETRTVEVHFAGRRTLNDCAFARGDLIVTVNGSTRVEVFRRRVDGAFDGPQTTTVVGSWHAVRSDGAERSCEVRIEIVRDPDAGTRTLRGMICGETVRRVDPWRPGG